MTLSLSGSDSNKNQDPDENAIKEGRSPTPVTVTHFSWGEAGKLEQRVISPSIPPARSPTPFMSLSVASVDSSVSTNPFVSQLLSETKCTTNPFLTYPNSNPFVDMTLEEVKSSEVTNEADSKNETNNSFIKDTPFPLDHSPVVAPTSSSPPPEKTVDLSLRVSLFVKQLYHSACSTFSSQACWIWVCFYWNSSVVLESYKYSKLPTILGIGWHAIRE